MAGQRTRRRLLGYGAVGLAAVLVGCGYQMTRPPVALSTAQASPGPVSAAVSRRIRLHMFQTGWVAVKREHRSFDGVPSQRLPAIMASRDWTEWLPVTAFVIEHPDGLFLVDTGETARILEPDYSACDPITGMFYRNNLQFSLAEDDEIGPQMMRAGLLPDRVAKVVMTHLHSDHMGGMRWFPKAQFLISAAARAGHTGALMCRIPPSLDLRSVNHGDRTAGVFAQSTALTTDGTISIVPTPGHANGHQSVLISDEGRSVCLVGDAAFSQRQAVDGDIGGIVENHRAATTSAQLLKAQLTQFQTVLLPTHDTENASRLRVL